MFQRGDEGDVWQHRDGGDQTARSDCLDCNSEPMVSRGSGVKEKKETWMTVGSGPAERRSRPSGEGWEVSRPAGKRRRGMGTARDARASRVAGKAPERARAFGGEVPARDRKKGGGCRV